MKKSELYKIVKEELQKELEEQRRGRLRTRGQQTKTFRPSTPGRTRAPEKINRLQATKLQGLATKFRIKPRDLVRIASDKGLSVDDLINFNEKDIFDLIGDIIPIDDPIPTNTLTLINDPGDSAGCAADIAYGMTEPFYSQNNCKSFARKDNFMCCGENNSANSPHVEADVNQNVVGCHCPSPVVDDNNLLVGCFGVAADGVTLNTNQITQQDYIDWWNTEFNQGSNPATQQGPPAGCGCGGVNPLNGLSPSDPAEYLEYYSNTFDLTSPIDISALTPLSPAPTSDTQQTSAQTGLDSLCQTVIIYGCSDENASNGASGGYHVIDNNTCQYPVTYNCVDNACTDPGNGSGEYGDLQACQDSGCGQAVVGCTDDTACNYNQDATEDTNPTSCTYAALNADCDGNCLEGYITNVDGDCVEVIEGCTSDTACNFNPDANNDDGSCLEPVADCYECDQDADGNIILSMIDDDEDGICNADDSVNNNATGCIDNGNQSAAYQNSQGGTGSPYPGIAACNYDDTAEVDDGSCNYTTCAGCTDSTATNYDSSATIDDGSCTFGPTATACWNFSAITCTAYGDGANPAQQFTDNWTCKTYQGDEPQVGDTFNTNYQFPGNVPGNTTDVAFEITSVSLSNLDSTHPSYGDICATGSCPGTCGSESSDTDIIQVDPDDIKDVRESKEIRNSLRNEFMISEEQKLRNLIRKTLLKRKK